MGKITTDLIYKTFADPRFEEAYQHTIKELKENDFFKHHLEWFFAHKQSGNYFRKELEEGINLILNGKRKNNILIGGNLHTDVDSIRVYQYIPWRIAQKIKIQKRSLFPPKFQKIIPFIGVDIVVDDSIKGLDVTNKHKDRWGHHAYLPRSMKGFPICYNQTGLCERNI